MQFWIIAIYFTIGLFTVDNFFKHVPQSEAIKNDDENELTEGQIIFVYNVFAVVIVFTWPFFIGGFIVAHFRNKNKP